MIASFLLLREFCFQRVNYYFTKSQWKGRNGEWWQGRGSGFRFKLLTTKQKYVILTIYWTQVVCNNDNPKIIINFSHHTGVKILSFGLARALLTVTCYLIRLIKSLEDSEIDCGLRCNNDFYFIFSPHFWGNQTNVKHTNQGILPSWLTTGLPRTLENWHFLLHHYWKGTKNRLASTMAHICSA